MGLICDYVMPRCPSHSLSFSPVRAVWRLCAIVAQVLNRASSTSARDVTFHVIVFPPICARDVFCARVRIGPQAILMLRCYEVEGVPI
jgi:hypothetical protein